MRRPHIASGLPSYAVAFVLVAIATLLALPLRGVTESGHIALFMLLAVWASAAIGGVGPGLFAAVLAFSVVLYAFVPPYYTVSVADPADWLTLGVFVTVAGLQGLLTGQMRDRERTASEAGRDADAFTRVAGQVVSESSAEVVGAIVTTEISRASRAERVAVLLQDEADKVVVLSASPEDAGVDAGIERYSRWVIANGVSVGIPPGAQSAEGPSELAAVDSVPHDLVVPGAQRNDVFMPISSPQHTEAVLYIGALANRRPITAREVRLAASLARLLGAFLERHRLQALASQAETAREADRLKSTLVSSVSHELKTPLAAMTATVSGLLAEDVEFDAERVRRDLESVDEGLKRLSASIGDLLDVSRLESDAWRARREPYEVSEIVGSLLGQLDASSRARIDVDVADDLPPIEVDFVQWSRALSNIVENALAYSGPEGHVRIGARHEGSAVLTWIEDDGPGITVEERDSVFEKFYRGSAAASVPSGTGLGLTIAQEIVRFNGGTIDVASAWPRGARFEVSVPAALGSAHPERWNA